MAEIVSHVSWGELPEGKRRVKLLKWQELGLSFTASGYGRRIPTSRMIRLGGRWRRVCCCIFSNAGTCYVEQGQAKNWIVVTD